MLDARETPVTSLYRYDSLLRVASGLDGTGSRKGSSDQPVPFAAERPIVGRASLMRIVRTCSTMHSGAARRNCAINSVHY